jgi:hypothetical protein
MTDERDAYTFDQILGPVVHSSHSIQDGLPPWKWHWQTQNINSWIVSGTPNTYFMWILLNHGSMTDERYPSTFYKVSSYYAHKLQYIKA